MPSSYLMMLTHRQLIYTLETAESAHLSASAAEWRSEVANRVGDPADEVGEDQSAIQMIGPSIRN